MVGFVVCTLDCMMRETVLSFPSHIAPGSLQVLPTGHNGQHFVTCCGCRVAAQPQWMCHGRSSREDGMASFLAISIVQQSCLRFTHA